MADDVFGIVGTTQAGSYHIERVVAEGGFGVVYRAQHGAFRAPVALKCLKVPRTMTEAQREEFLEKFRAEAELLFRLSASISEVVRPLHADALHLEGHPFVPYLALEWLDGEALDAIVTKRRDAGQPPIGLHKLVRLLKPIAHALSRAHRFPGPNGPEAIIHRDIKPENILVGRHDAVDTVKILDFGIAKCQSAAHAIAGRQTGGEVINAFSPAYAAPEQWLPKRYGAAGPWTDVWGLAITMVEVLAGHAPIDGELPAMMGTAIDEGRRPTPRAEGVALDTEIDAVFARALAVDPRDRTQSVDRFWTELEMSMGTPSSFAAYDPRREDDEPGAGRQHSSGPPAVSSRFGRRARTPHDAGQDFELDLEPEHGRGRVEKPFARRPGHSSDPAPLTVPSLGAPALAPPRVPAAIPPEMALRPATPLSSLPPDDHGPPLQLASLAPRAEVASRAAAGFGLDPNAPRYSSRPPPALGARLLTPSTATPLPIPGAPGTPSLGTLDSSSRALPALDHERGLLADPRNAPGSESLRTPLLTPSRRPPPMAVAGPRPGARSLVQQHLREAGSQLAELDDLRERLRLPMALIGVALAITFLDVALAHLASTSLSFGPFRPWWVTGPLGIAGVGLTVYRIFMGGRDG
ncbi:MAG: protein kinase [Polyangiaceae bacterium]